MAGPNQQNLLDRYRKEIIAFLSAVILLGSGISLGLGISELGRAPVSIQSSGLERAASSDSVTIKPQTSGPININTASATELEALPEIGPALASRIVDYRQQNGSFKTAAEIQDVSGIGPATYAQIKDQITVK